MILYEVINRQINTLSMAEGIAGLPIEFALQHKVIWLGDESGDTFSVQIMKDKQTKGWLYSDLSMALFKYENLVYECSILKLREFAQESLKEKIFSNEEALNTMKKELTGEVVGYLSMSEVLKLSNIIPDVD